MSIIKGFHKLNGLKSPLVSAESMAQLENEALQYKIHWNITFEILGVQPASVLIKATQGPKEDRNYTSKLMIVNETKKMFGKYIPISDIYVRVSINIPSPPSIVDSKWLRETMYETGIFLTEMQSATGIDSTTLNEWISDKTPMNQTTRAMFYYYLLHMRNLREVQPK